LQEDGIDPANMQNRVPESVVSTAGVIDRSRRLLIRIDCNDGIDRKFNRTGEYLAQSWGEAQRKQIHEESDREIIIEQ
jgi:hypothetical protein